MKKREQITNVKGKRGFQSKTEAEKIDKRISTYLKQIEKDRLEAYLKKHNTTISELVRERLKDIIYKDIAE